MNRTRYAQLWGGPEDGARLWMPPGDLPARVGAHRTARGELVPIRGHALVMELEHLPVYERLTAVLAHHFPAADPAVLLEPDAPVYLWAPLVTRWAARQ
jgi:hypothetical protein